MLRSAAVLLVWAVTICIAKGWSFHSEQTLSLNALSERKLSYLNSINENELVEILNYGVESVEQLKRFEANLISSQIVVRNGSLSHAQLLDTLPNVRAQRDSESALKIMKASQYFYNAKCAPMSISAEHCAAYLSQKYLPSKSNLNRECHSIVNNRYDAHHPFRRLLAKKYMDGLNEMYTGIALPAPLLISNQALHSKALPTAEEHDQMKSSAIVQWSQFIEHDLSKPVVFSMNNGLPIECCSTDNAKLQPRFHHTACVPLMSQNTKDTNGRINCLNYVRSALTLQAKCTFGAVEKLNQATGTLDLSQLYGLTTNDQNNLRSFKNGQLQHSHMADPVKRQLLPLATNNFHLFCASTSVGNDSTCFMSGDSRVNQNPFSILIYTIFLRNHNQIALKLKQQNPQSNDNTLFEKAKSINIQIYRNIVLNEWLPELLGRQYTEQTLSELNNILKVTKHEPYISNEFAVAAIRFYYSMMPNSLHEYREFVPIESNQSPNALPMNKLPIFVLQNQFYKPQMTYNSDKLDAILESLLNQNAMKMDAVYVDSLIAKTSTNQRPTHADILAFDIQRGRDHGLQGYVEYVKACSGYTVDSWKDLETLISQENVEKIRSVYLNVADIDLIVGGIAEIPSNESTVGPTFSCILAEQFSRIRLWVQQLPRESSFLNTASYESITAADLLCMNSELKFVQKNIFQLPSKQNPLIACTDRY